MSGTPNERDAFDAAYYRRYYEDARTRVTTPVEVETLARFVCSYLKHLRLPVKRVVDLGCGMGYWRAPVLAEFPRARYTGVEYSEYMCERMGWTHGSVVDFSARGAFDLVICQGVLQYLGDEEAGSAIENMGRLCRGALYLEALTREDWQHNCDRGRTDPALKLRLASWYRRALKRDFIACGGGVFVRNTADITLYELERA